MGSRTQKEFAEWLGESPTTVNGYFTGASRPKIEFLRSLAAKGVNLNWLLTGIGEVYIKKEGKSGLPPEAQVFLAELVQDGTPVENLPEIMKYLKDLREHQRHTDAAKEQLRVGLQIAKEQFKKRKTDK